MVAEISGSGLGLFNSSGATLGKNGVSDNSNLGQGQEQVYVNTTTGNLVIQHQDDFLSSIGQDLSVIRTYNSQGQIDGDNNDNWKIGLYRRVYNLTGTAGVAGSAITKVFGDGAEVIYSYLSTNGQNTTYVSSDGDGANDTLTYNASTSEWTWSDGSSRNSEVYDTLTNGGLIKSATDADGNTFAYTFSGSLLTQVSNTAGQTVYLDYTGNNLTKVRVTELINGQTKTQTLTSYTYDGNRLQTVTVDLSPSDNSITDNNVYTTTYTYDGDSNRVASVTQKDGTTVRFTYQLVDGSWHVKTYTDGNENATTFNYDQIAVTTAAADASRLVTTESMTSSTNYELSPAYLTDAAAQDVTATYNLNAAALTSGGPGSYEIDNRISVTGINIESNWQWTTYRLTVPQGASELVVNTWGGSGDVVIAATYGSTANWPDAISDDNLNGSSNGEQVRVKNPQAGVWYISLRANESVQGLNLQARYLTNTDTPVMLHTGEAIEDISGDAEEEQLYSFEVPVGTHNFNVTLSGNNGNADLYLKQGMPPSAFDWANPPADIASRSAASNESVSVDSPVAGTWYVLVRGESKYSNAKLLLETNIPSVPTVRTDSPQRVDSSSTVTLHAQGTSASGALSYHWTQIAGPSVMLNNADSASASFVAPVVSTATQLDFQVMVTDERGIATTDVQHVMVGSSPTNGQLLNWIATENVSVPVWGESNVYTIDVPENATELDLETSGGVGDIAMFARLGGVPSADDGYDAGSFNDGTSQQIHIQSPQAGLWYIRLSAGAIESTGISLVARYQTGVSEITSLTPGHAISDLYGTQDSERIFSFDVAQGTDDFRLALSGDNGNAEVYVKQGSVPSQFDYDTVSRSQNINKLVEVDHPAQGTWYVLVKTRADFSSAKLSLYKNLPVTAPSVTTDKPQRASQGSTVDLIADASDDVVSYEWTQTSGPTVTLTNSTTAQLSFTAPNVTAPTYLEFRVKVTNDQGLTNTSTVQVLVDAPRLGYTVQAGDTWQSIASTLYGTTLVGEQLFHQLGEPTLLMGERFTELPGNITLTRTEIQNWIPINDINVPAENWISPYTIVVPEGATELNINTSGGSGDIALAARYGAVPSFEGVFDNASWATGTSQQIHIQNPHAGVWYIQLGGGSGDSSGIQLVTNYQFATDDAQPLVVGQAENDLYGAVDSERRFSFTVDQSITSFQLALSGINGDADVFLKHGSPPSSDGDYDLVANTDTINEIINQSNPAVGSWYVLVKGRSSFADAKLVLHTNLSGSAPDVDAGINQAATAGATIHLNAVGTGSSPLSYHWMQLEGPAVALQNANSVSAQFVAPSATAATHLTFQVKVTDSNGVTNTDVVHITLSVSTNYTVESGDSWDSIAETLYGSPAVAGMLQSQFGSVPLSEGMHLTGLPLTLSDTKTTTVAHPGYYAVEEGDTWSSIANKFYSFADTGLIGALQNTLGNPTLAVGLHLIIPLELTYQSSTETRLETTVTDALNHVSHYQHDALGRLTAVVSPSIYGAGLTTSYAYDVNGNVISITEDPAGLNRLTKFQYDEKGNLTSSRDADGVTVTRTYSDDNQLLTETQYITADPDGDGPGLPSNPRTTRYVYDNHDNLRFVVTPEGRITEYRYTAEGQRTSQRIYASVRYTPVDQLSSEDSIPELTISSWLANSTNVTSADLSKLEIIDYTYDFRGNISTATSYSKADSNGNGIGSTSSIVQYVYDQRGMLLQKIDARADASIADGLTSTLPFSTTYVYDGLGRITSTTEWVRMGDTDINESSTATVTRTTGVIYDDVNNKIVTTSYNGLIATTVYDHTGAIVSNNSSNNGSINATTTFTYDAAGRLRKTTDPTGAKQYIVYDNAGRKVAEVGANALLTEFVYNNTSQLTKAVRYADAIVNTSLLNRLENTDEVSVSELTASLSGDRAIDQISRVVYDQAGRTIYTIDAAGAVTQYFYDGRGRITDTVQYANPVDVPAGVDEIHALQGDLVAGIGNTRTFVNSSGVVVGSLQLDPNNDRRTHNFYNNDGYLAGTVDAAGYLTENIYDAAGRLVKQIAYANKTSVPFWITGTLESIRPLADHETAVDHETDITTYNYYDGQGRLTGTLDGEGYLTEITYNKDGSIKQTDRYDVYDSVSGVVTRRILQANDSTTLQTLHDAAIAAPIKTIHTTSYTYDGVGRKVSETNYQNTTTKYTYDDAHNLHAVIEGYGTSDARKTQVQYDEAGRVIGTLSAEGSYAIANNVDAQTAWNRYGISYAYDQSGHRVSASSQHYDRDSDTYRTDKTYYYYDASGQLRFTVNALGEVSEIRYNSLGQVTDVIQYANRSSTTGLNGGLLSAAFIAALTSGADASLDSKTSYTYDLRGQTLTTTTVEGQRTVDTYTTFGQLLSQSVKMNGPQNILARNAYDVRGLLTKTEVDPYGTNHTETYSYDAFGRRYKVVDQYGNTTKVDYDSLGRTVATYDALNKKASITYDAFSRTMQTTDRNGNTTKYQYDDATKKITVIAPTGSTTVTESNAFGEMVKVTDASNAITTTLYNHDGNVVDITVAAGTINASTTHYSYDTHDRVLSVVEGSGTASYRETQYVYDAVDRRTQEIVKNANVYSADNHYATADLVTQYRYDAKGNLGRKIDPANNSTWYVYDKDNRLTYTIDALGGVTLNTYDQAGHVVAVRRYANPISNAQLSALTANNVDQAQLGTDFSIVADANNDRLEQCIYDNAGRQIYEMQNVMLLDQATGVYQPKSVVTQMDYDADGNIVKKIAYANAIAQGAYIRPSDISTLLVADAINDHIIWSAYDADNRVVFTVQAAGVDQNNNQTRNVTQYAYDNNGNVIETIAYASQQYSAVMETSSRDAGIPQRWTIPFNDMSAESLGNWVTLSNIYGQHIPDNRVTRYWYDSANRLRYTLDAEGYLAETRYDDVARTQTRIVYSTQQTIAANADAADIVPSTDTQHDQKTKTVFDQLGRIQSVIYTIDAAGNTSSETYAYDAVGNKIQYTNQKGAQWDYQYDANHRLILERAPPVAVTTVLTGTNGGLYDAGTNTSVRIETAMSYDALGNLRTRTESSNAGIPRTTTYDYDQLGRQIKTIYPQVSVTDDQGGFTTSPQTLSSSVFYDFLGNAYKNIDVAGNTSYKTYDQLGHVIYEIDALGYVTNYDYDAFGNQIKLTRYTGQFTGVMPPSGSNDAFMHAGDNPVSGAFTTAGMLARVIDPTSDRTIITRYDRLNRKIEVKQPAIFTFDATATAESGSGAGSSLQQITPTTLTLGDPQSWSIANPLSLSAPSLLIFDITYDQAFTTGGPDLYFGGLDENGNQITEHIDGFPNQPGHYTYVSVNRFSRLDFAAINNTNTTGTTLGISYSIPSSGASTSAAQTFTASPTTKYEYNAFGQVAREHRLVNANTNSYANTYYYYDHKGNKSAQIDPMGYLTTYEYDETGDLKTQTEYATPLVNWDAIQHDATGDWSIVQGQVPNFVPGTDHETIFAYDQLNRKVSQTIVGVEVASTDTSGLILSNGQVSTTLTSQVTTYGYDAVGNQTTVTMKDVVTNGTMQDVATYTYFDSLGRVIGMAEPTRDRGDDTTITPFTQMKRDAYGNLVEQIQYAQGVAPVTSYSDGVLPTISTNVANDGTNRTTFMYYDIHGNLIQTQDAMGYNHFMAYNKQGKVVKESQAVTNTQFGITISNADQIVVYHQYDKVGREVTTITPQQETTQTVTWPLPPQLTNGNVVIKRVTYDAFGEVTSRGINNDTQQSAQEYFDYDQAGNLWRTNAGDGVDKVYLHNAAGQVTAEIRATNVGADGVVIDNANSSEPDLKSMTLAQILALPANSVVRTETVYNKLGQVVEQRQPEFAITQSSNAVTALTGNTTTSISSSITASELVNYDGNGSILFGGGDHQDYYEWVGKNKITLTWPSIGSQAIVVDVDYVSAAGTDKNGSTLSAPRSETYSEKFNSGDTGISLEWNLASMTGHPYSQLAFGLTPNSNAGGISQVARIRVYAQDANGNRGALLRDTMPTATGELAWNLPLVAGDTAAFTYGNAATASTTVIRTSTDTQKIDVSTLADGTYDFTLALTHAGQTLAYAKVTGSFTVQHIAGSINVVMNNVIETAMPVTYQTSDRWGNVLSSTDASSNTINYLYNVYGQVTKVIAPQVDTLTTTGTIAQGTHQAISLNFYDSLGHMIGTEDGNGNRNAVVYNNANQVVKEIHADQMNGVHGGNSYVYDLFGEKIQKSEIADASTSYRTRYAYDKDGRLTTQMREVTDAAHGGFGNSAVEVTSFSLTNGSSNIIDNPNVQTLIYTYDEAGRRLSETSGALMNDQSGNQETTHYRYDLMGHVIATRRPAGTTDGARDITYEYDSFGMGKKTKETMPVVSTLLSQDFQTWSYDYFGKLTSHRDLGGAVTSYNYGTETGLLNSQTSNLGQNIAYSYDAAGHLISIADHGIAYGGNGTDFNPALASVNRDTQYTYDVAGRVVREKITMPSLNVVLQDAQTTYDSLNRVSHIADLKYDTTYFYDAAGNRTRIESNYFDVEGIKQPSDLWYTYDSMNRVVFSQAKGSVGGVVNFFGDTGIKLTYNLHGDRVMATQSGIAIEKRDKVVINQNGPPSMKTEYRNSNGYSIPQADEVYHYDGLGRLRSTDRTQIEVDYVHLDASGYPQITQSTVEVDHRTYDGASRMLTQEAFHVTPFYQDPQSNQITGGTFDEDTSSNIYSDDGLIRSKSVSQSSPIESYTLDYGNGDATYSTTQTEGSNWSIGYDAAGVLHGYKMTLTMYNGYTSNYYMNYRKGDSYQQTHVHVSSATTNNTLVPLPGDSFSYYDVDGALVKYIDSKDSTRDRQYLNNQDGLALAIVQGDVANTSATASIQNVGVSNHTQLTLNFVNQGQQAGSVQYFSTVTAAQGTIWKTSANFDINYTPISENYPGTVPSQVVVQLGDTLHVIAARIYGDANLWYLIAEENGLSDPDAALVQGTVLQVPSNVVSLNNTSTVFKPYDVQAAIGDTTPFQPSPPIPPFPDSTWEALGAFFAIIVSAIITYYTGGYTTAGYKMLGNSIAQFYNIENGKQGHFRWKGWVASGVEAANNDFLDPVTASVSNSLIQHDVDHQKFDSKLVQKNFVDYQIDQATSAASSYVGGVLDGVSEAAAQVAIAASNAAAHELARSEIYHDYKFNWRNVAAAAVASTVSQGASYLDASQGTSQLLSNVAYHAVADKGHYDWGAVAADAFGNILGNALVETSPYQRPLGMFTKPGDYADPRNYPVVMPYTSAGNAWRETPEPETAENTDQSPGNHNVSLNGNAPSMTEDEKQTAIDGQNSWLPGGIELNSINNSSNANLLYPVRVLNDDGSLSNGYVTDDESNTILTGGIGRSVRGAGKALELAVNQRAMSAMDTFATLDPTGALGAYRDSSDVGAFLNELGRQNAIEKLRTAIGSSGYKVPTPEQLGIYPGYYPDGADGAVQRYDSSELLDGYREAARLVSLHQQGVIDLDFNTYRINTIGTEKLTPEQFSAEIESRYQKAFTAGVQQGGKQFSSGTLRYPVDMPEQLQVGLFADNYARQDILRYTQSIGVPEGPGQLISLNRWSYDPVGTGLYTRPDILMNLGLGDVRVLDAKTTLFKDMLTSSSVRSQFQNYYRYGATTVKMVTPEGTYIVPRSNYSGKPK